MIEKSKKNLRRADQKLEKMNHFEWLNRTNKKMNKNKLRRVEKGNRDKEETPIENSLDVYLLVCYYSILIC